MRKTIKGLSYDKVVKYRIKYIQKELLFYYERNKYALYKTNK
jgi:hypothetical protein